MMDIKNETIIDKIRTEFNVTVAEEIIKKGRILGTDRVFRKGDIILGMGKPMTKTYLIIKGIARSYYLDIDGNDITKSFMKEYDFCIGESIFANEKSGEGFEALEDIVALEFEAKKLKEYLLSEKILTQIYIKMLEQTIIYKMNRENGFQTKSATERYIDFKKKYADVEKRVNQSYIASYLGITPVSLSRIRRTIKEEY